MSVVQLIDIMVAANSAATRYAELLQNAKRAGRDDLTDEEVEQVRQISQAREKEWLGGES